MIAKLMLICIKYIFLWERKEGALKGSSVLPGPLPEVSNHDCYAAAKLWSNSIIVEIYSQNGFAEKGLGREVIKLVIK